MWKCSFFVFWGVLALLRALPSVQGQEYDVGEPAEGEVVFNGVRGSDVALLFDSQEVIVNPGEKLNLDCGVQGEFRSCVWETAVATYQVEDVYSNLYPVLERPASSENNQCGLVINSVDIEHHGMWTCKVYVRGNSLVAKKKVVVTIKPTTPVLEIEQNGGILEVSNSEETEVKCSVAGARPAADIRWYLADQDITVFAAADQTPNGEEDMHKTVSTLTRTFEPSENGRRLTCTVMHQTLPVPDNTSIPISVIFKPIEKPLSTYYQIVPGSDYEVRLNFSANPPPTRTEWRHGDSFQNMAASIPASHDRYITEVEELGDGHYTAKLRIPGFTDEDANQRYVLLVENRIGETQYQVKLSMDEAPLDGDSENREHDNLPPTEFSLSEGIVFGDETQSNALSGGAVAGIIIVILIVVVAVVAAGYARYRQMFCFAPAAAADPEEGKDIKEEHSDTESARGPNTTRAANIKNSIGKLTQVFKKPKKEQETKLEEGAGGEEDKKHVKDETKKGSPKKEQGDEKELPGQTQIPSEMTQLYTNSEFKSPEVQKQLTDDKKTEINLSQPNNDQKPPEQKNEVVYAELDLSKGEGDKKLELKSEEKTQYAQIIGTVTDNREEEKKE
ncbi:fasciclin-3-like isoform X3 [Palaemon carinicauda]|uniref:fasciclin-3-like isoform X3 n=1 Tax=Palaemon carinicauda TaxID=392227 RepID=UPI0035B61D53